MIKPSILANNVFYYYADLQKALDFYQDILGFEPIADYGFAKMLRIAKSSHVLFDLRQAFRPQIGVSAHGAHTGRSRGFCVPVNGCTVGSSRWV